MSSGIPTDYNYAQHTPVDNTGKSYSVFRSGYKNIRFALSATRTYTVTQADEANLAGIAYKLYSDSSFWYMLLAFNALKDPLQQVVAGLILKVPSKSDVIAYLSAQQNTQLPVFKI